jgi:hypothetical protein
LCESMRHLISAIIVQIFQSFLHPFPKINHQNKEGILYRPGLFILFVNLYRDYFNPLNDRQQFSKAFIYPGSATMTNCKNYL